MGSDYRSVHRFVDTQYTHAMKSMRLGVTPADALLVREFPGTIERSFGVPQRTYALTRMKVKEAAHEPEDRDQKRN